MIAQYIKYRLKAKGIQSLHSPFLFEFYKRYKQNKKLKLGESINQLYTKVLSETTVINASGYGAGSRKGGQAKAVKDLAKLAGMSKKEIPLIKTLLDGYKKPRIVELGTNLGVGTGVIALLSQNPSITSFEGNIDLLNYAKTLHASLDIKNIEYVKGDIHKTLDSKLDEASLIDICYIDADHRYEATLSFFNKIKPYMAEKGVMVLDDIYWSKEMTKAWNEIIMNNSVSISVDMFDKGLLFFDPNLSKQHFVLRQ